MLLLMIVTAPWPKAATTRSEASWRARPVDQLDEAYYDGKLFFTMSDKGFRAAGRRRG
jgi:hypothetical protein